LGWGKAMPEEAEYQNIAPRRKMDGAKIDYEELQ
jgi:hypothetical protein